MSIQCPDHKMDVIPMWTRTHEVKTGFRRQLAGVINITTSKCPEFGCSFSVESDEYGVVIRDSKGGS